MTAGHEKIRLPFVDALRGLAVVLMVQQHLQAWLWEKTWLSYGLLMAEHPVMASLNSLGLLAAPLFFLLAGFGSAERHERGARPFAQVRRGYTILCCAYLLNMFSPHWFAPWSWYSLHCIGAALIFSPLFHGRKTVTLVVLTALVFFSSALIQTYLDTPLLLSGSQLNDAGHAGGVFRLILAEGHFPLFPWISFFIAGIICHRLYRRGFEKYIPRAGIMLAVAGIAFAALYNYGYAFASRGTFLRFFIFMPFFYPPLPPLLLVLLGSAMTLFYLFEKAGHTRLKCVTGLLVYPGRSALTWFVLHILFFNEFIRFLGFHKCFSPMPVLAVTVVFIVFMVWFSRLWQRHDYRYGVEWAVRKFGG